MLNNFEPKHLQYAKFALTEDIQRAERLFARQKEQEKEREKPLTFLEKVKKIFKS